MAKTQNKESPMDLLHPYTEPVKAKDPLIDLVLLRHLAELGMSEKQMAVRLNIDPAVFRFLRKNDANVEGIIQRGFIMTYETALENIMNGVMAGDLKWTKIFIDRWDKLNNTEGTSLAIKPSVNGFNLQLIKTPEPEETDD